MIEYVAKIHNYIMGLNDKYEYDFSDKQLHFLVIGVIGMLLIFIVYPLFKWLARTGHVMVIAWIYVFTVILVITFAIEIGQKVTNTGNMEFADIVFGVVGFFDDVFHICAGAQYLSWDLKPDPSLERPLINSNTKAV